MQIEGENDLEEGLFLYKLDLSDRWLSPTSTLPLSMVLARYRLLGLRAHFLNSFVCKCLYFSTAQVTGKIPNIFSVLVVKTRI